MPEEIERKFLVLPGSWNDTPPVLYCQGYLNSHKERTVRVRIAGNEAFLTIKGLNQGPRRQEFEYPLPLREAEELLELCEKPLISKYRRKIRLGSVTWEIDEFTGENEGLIIAEVELTSPEQEFDRPEWLGEEVTHDSRYFNSNLVRYPYSFWRNPEAEQPPPDETD